MYEIGTGAQCSIISFNNSKIPIPGECLLTLRHKNFFDVLFIVVDSESIPFLGLWTSESLNHLKLISVVNVNIEQILSEYSDCFGEIGTLKNTQHVEIDSNVTPVVTRVRKILLNTQIRKGIKMYLRLGYHWTFPKINQVNELGMVEKPNEQWMKTYEQSHETWTHPLPTAEEISQTSEVSYFSKLDANSGYWQIEIDEQSYWRLVLPQIDITYKCLPYQIHPAEGSYLIIADITGSANSQDHFIVWGKTLQEHDKHLKNIFLKIRDIGLILNKQKQLLKCAFQGQLMNYRYLLEWLTT